MDTQLELQTTYKNQLLGESMTVLAELSPNGVFVIQGERIVYANAAGLRLLGASHPGQVIGHPYAEFQAPEFQQSTRERFARALQTDSPNPVLEQTFIRLDGQRVTVEAFSAAALFHGQPSIHAIIRDISERKRLAHSLETLATLSEAMRSVTTQAEVLRTFLDVMEKTFSAGGAALLATPCSHQTPSPLFRGLAAQAPIPALVASKEVNTELCVNRAILNFPGDALTDSHSFGDLMSAWPAGIHAVAVPLMAEQNVNAVLWLFRRDPFGDVEISMLEAIRRQAGTSIQRAELSDHLQQTLRRMESLRSIDGAINATLNLQVTLDLLLEQVTAMLDADAVSILSLDESNRLSYKAGRGFHTRLVVSANLKVGDLWAGQAALNKKMIKVTQVSLPLHHPQLSQMVAAEGFESYFAAPLQSGGVLIGVLEIFMRHPFEPDQDWLSFFMAIAEQASLAIRNADLFDGLQRAKSKLEIAYQATLAGWVHALDLRDDQTGGHTDRVTDLCLRLARAMQVPPAELPHYYRGALLHDIGKIAIPDSILLKAGPLDDSDWAQMKKHPENAHQWLSSIEYLRPALDIPYCHHEKWDGSGYPQGLSGKQIPMAARIFAVVDVWDALLSDRPYRKALSPAEAWNCIRKERGSHFDPVIVDAFEREFVRKGALPILSQDIQGSFA